MDHENGNDHWMLQIPAWQEELEQLIEHAPTLLALIVLAKSQLESQPPE